MAFLNPHLLILSVLILSLLLKPLHLPSICTFDLRLAPPNLLIAVVLSIFFGSVLLPVQVINYSYISTSTSDKFITVAVGNGS
uniref:Movement protein 2 n=1 Tax=Jasmine mosaic-associated virus 2 TaxID=2293881 RepID=A0A346LWB1_9TOMB|nr:movement protein 2 [Jasmine mosaic-associated virus 2]QGA84525.1 movement protein 2 [Jasmine mosaic-associated virus 2]